MKTTGDLSVGLQHDSLPRVRGSPKKRSTNPLNELGTSKLIKKNIIVHYRS